MGHGRASFVGQDVGEICKMMTQQQAEESRAYPIRSAIRRAHEKRMPFLSISAVYILYQGSKPIYVGMAKNLGARLGQHASGRAKKNFTHYAFIQCDEQQLREVERIAVALLRPELNIKDGRMIGDRELLPLKPMRLRATAT